MDARFLERAKAALKDYDEEDLEAEAGECPVCNEGMLSPHTLRLSVSLIAFQCSPISLVESWRVAMKRASVRMCELVVLVTCAHAP